MQAQRTVASFISAIALSALFGVAERILQDHSTTGWYLANIAAVWLTVAFAFGAFAQRSSRALLIGLITELSALAGFYGYMHYGEHHTEPHHLIAFWTCCGVIAGPLFGMLGYAWRRRRSKIAGLALAAMFISEAILLDLSRARPHSITTLELIAGILLAALLLAALRGRTTAPRTTIRVSPPNGASRYSAATAARNTLTSRRRPTRDGGAPTAVP